MTDTKALEQLALEWQALCPVIESGWSASATPVSYSVLGETIDGHEVGDPVSPSLAFCRSPQAAAFFVHALNTDVAGALMGAAAEIDRLLAEKAVLVNDVHRLRLEKRDSAAAERAACAALVRSLVGGTVAGWVSLSKYGERAARAIEARANTPESTCA